MTRRKKLFIKIFAVSVCVSLLGGGLLLWFLNSYWRFTPKPYEPKVRTVKDSTGLKKGRLKHPKIKSLPENRNRGAYGMGFYVPMFMPDFDNSYIPDSLRPIWNLDEDNKLSFRERLKLVHNLPKKLTKRELTSLYSFLKFGENNDNGYVLKNDILNHLRSLNIDQEELVDVMLDLYYNKKENVVVRDYMLQHLQATYWEGKTTRKELLQKAFYDGLEETNTQISAVAMLSLTRLSERYPEIDRQKIKDAALAIAQDEYAFGLSRITAVQLCGRLKVNEVLPQIREIASESNSTTMRIAAIAGIGEIGEEADMELLKKILEDDKKRFHAAANSAMKKLNKRLN